MVVDDYRVFWTTHQGRVVASVFCPGDMIMRKLSHTACITWAACNDPVVEIHKLFTSIYLIGCMAFPTTSCITLCVCVLRVAACCCWGAVNARNVLVCSSRGAAYGAVAKLADLGLSRVIRQQATHKTTNTVGTLRWADHHTYHTAGRGGGGWDRDWRRKSRLGLEFE